MIVIDPSLEADSAALASAGRKATAPPKAKPTAKTRLPSKATLTNFLRKAQCAVGLDGEVTVLLTSDPAIRKLNRQFRGKDKATDVLSFPAEGPAAMGIAGDLAISVPTAERQAAVQCHSLVLELRVLILHGLLHLAGYDHETDSGQMARRERRLREMLCLPVGLIERTSTQKPKKSSKKDRS